MQSPIETTASRRIKSKEVKNTRLELLELQENTCAICRLPCSLDQAVLDHTHKAGHIRAVLHRGCNAVEGKVVNAIKRYGIADPAAFLAGLIKYHEVHRTDQTGLIHPTFKTAEEKKALAKKRAQRKRLAAKKARAILG